jgi:choline dehydrogenase-like flavoprotein
VKKTHKGLYVIDAAAVPGALGVSPTFTIVAQAVRVVDNALKG